MCDRTAEDEAAGLDAGNTMNVATGEGLHQLIHGPAKSRRILKQSRDVTKDDALFRVVGNRANQAFDTHDLSLGQRTAGHGIELCQHCRVAGIGVGNECGIKSAIIAGWAKRRALGQACCYRTDQSAGLVGVVQ